MRRGRDVAPIAQTNFPALVGRTYKGAMLRKTFALIDAHTSERCSVRKSAAWLEGVMAP